MDVPPHVVRWVDEHYQRPKIDPEWLSQCYEWLISEGHNAATKFRALTDALNHQILESNLADSMLPGSGFPPQVTSPDTTMTLLGAHVLVEIVSITEVAHSAFNLNQTRVAIEERMKEGNVEEGEGEGDLEVEGEGPMPKYPRGMLKFHISDGSVTIPAMEYRPLPQLSILTTLLGFKLFLKNVQIRRGVVFLEPNTITLIGHRTEDRDANRHRDFARGLRMRMGLPISDQEEEVRQHQPEEMQSLRSPLREISPPLSPTLPQRNNEDDMGNRKRRLPNQRQEPTPASTSATLVASATSKYFDSSGSSGVSSNRAPASSSIQLDLSPPRRNNVPLFLGSPAPSPPIDEHFWSDDLEMLDPEQENRPQHQQQPTAGPSTQQSNLGGPNIRVLGKLKERTGKSIQNAGKGKAIAATNGWSSDDYGDMSLDIDDAVLDAIEKQGYASQQKSAPTGKATSVQLLGSKRPMPPPSQLPNRPEVVDLTRSATLEVITIDDDEDAVDKENVPVAARNVRRRTEQSPTTISAPPRSQRPPGRARILAKTESAVIDLSDSD